MHQRHAYLGTAAEPGSILVQRDDTAFVAAFGIHVVMRIESGELTIVASDVFRAGKVYQPNCQLGASHGVRACIVMIKRNTKYVGQGSELVVG